MDERINTPLRAAHCLFVWVLLLPLTTLVGTLQYGRAGDTLLLLACCAGGAVLAAAVGLLLRRLGMMLCLLIATLAALAGSVFILPMDTLAVAAVLTVGAFTALCVKAVHTPTEAFFRPGVTTLCLVVYLPLYLVLMMQPEAASEPLWNVLRAGAVGAVAVLFYLRNRHAMVTSVVLGNRLHDQADGMRIVPATVRRSNRWLLLVLVAVAAALIFSTGLQQLVGRGVSALLLGLVNSGELLDKLRNDDPIGIDVSTGPDGSQGGTVLEMPPASETHIAVVQVLGMIGGVILLGIILWGVTRFLRRSFPGIYARIAALFAHRQVDQDEQGGYVDEVEVLTRRRRARAVKVRGPIRVMPSGDNRLRLRDLYRQFALRRKENRAQTPNEFITLTLGDSPDAARFAQGYDRARYSPHAVSDEEIAAAARAVAAQSAK